MPDLEFDMIECDRNRWQWECNPTTGVTAYSHPSTREGAERRAIKLADALGREPIIIDQEDSDGY